MLWAASVYSSYSTACCVWSCFSILTNSILEIPELFFLVLAKKKSAPEEGFSASPFLLIMLSFERTFLTSRRFFSFTFVKHKILVTWQINKCILIIAFPCWDFQFHRGVIYCRTLKYLMLFFPGNCMS